jgi:tetratricopeptide (TPR) repeat protein
MDRSNKFHKIIGLRNIIIICGVILALFLYLRPTSINNQINILLLKTILNPSYLDNDEAITSQLRDLEEFCITRPQYCYYSAKGAYLLGNTQLAKTFLSISKAYHDNHPLDLYWWGRIFFDAGDLEIARGYWARAGILRVMAEIPFNEGVRSSHQGNLDEANNHFQQAVLIDPSFGFAHYRIGQIYWTFGQWQDAKQAYGNALATLEPNTFQWYTAKGKICLIDSDLICEVAAFKEAVDQSPNDYAALMHWARALIKQEQDNNAETALKQAQLVNPKNKDTYLLLGNLYLRGEKWELAFEQFQKGAELTENPVVYWIGSAKALAEMGKSDKALDVLREVLIIDPENLEALQIIGELQPSQ